MKLVIAWKRLDAVGAEYAEMAFDPLRIEGEVVLVDDGTPCAVSYRVVCDSSGVTSRAVVGLRRRGVLSECTLVRDTEGSWTLNGRPVPQLDGLCDVDLSITPSTNTLPIRRLGLEMGQRAEVTAAWVMFPSLDVVPLVQSYRRIDLERYEYEAPEHAFRAEMTVDLQGVVKTYGALWERCGATPGE